jgi:hypothetical protein
MIDKREKSGKMGGIWDAIGRIWVPTRTTRSNLRGVKRKMSGYKLRSRSTQKAKTLKIRRFCIVINTN